MRGRRQPSATSLSVCLSVASHTFFSVDRDDDAPRNVPRARCGGFDGCRCRRRTRWRRRRRRHPSNPRKRKGRVKMAQAGVSTEGRNKAVRPQKRNVENWSSRTGQTPMQVSKLGPSMTFVQSRQQHANQKVTHLFATQTSPESNLDSRRKGGGSSDFHGRPRGMGQDPNRAESKQKLYLTRNLFYTTGKSQACSHRVRKTVTNLPCEPEDR